MGSRRNSRSGHSKGGSHKAPAQQDKASNPIAAATAQSQPKATQAEAKVGENQPENRYERRIANWTVVVGAFTVVLAIATVGSGYILWLTDHTLRDTLESSNRAWVAPISGDFVKPPVPNQPISVRVSYQNVGKEPAIKANHFQQLSIAQAVKRPDGSTAIQPWPNATCNSVTIDDNGQTIYPTASPLYGSAIPPSSAVVLNDQVVSGDQILVWQGCFKYETMKRERRSSFCYWLRKDGDQFSWSFCPTGNSAT